MSAWTVAPTLAGRHVTLRPLARADRAGLLAAFADGFDGAFYTTVPHPGTIDAWLDQLVAEQLVGRAMPFAVLDHDGGIAGTTRFMRMAPRHRRVEIGGTLHAGRVRRTGLNTEAKRLLLGYAFETMDCLCVQLRTDWLNRHSRAAIERLGAKQDGVLRNHLIMPDGHHRDTLVYSIIAAEWPGVRANLDAMLARHEGDGA